MEKVTMHRIFFFAAAAVGASLFSSALLYAAQSAGPGQPALTGIALGIALAGIAAFYRWFFERQFRKPSSPAVYAWVAVGAALVAAFAYAAGWAERQAWLLATATLAAWWGLHSLVLAKRSKPHKME